jgi:hypothetical protein
VVAGCSLEVLGVALDFPFNEFLHFVQN